jgi:TPR repeat protein
MCPPKLDWIKCRSYSQDSADQGNVVALAFHSFNLWTYCGGDQDVPGATHYSEMALEHGLQEMALSGCKKACYVLAEMYYTALGVPWNDRMAFALHSRALSLASSLGSYAFLRTQGMPNAADANKCLQGGMAAAAVCDHEQGFKQAVEIFTMMSNVGMAQAMWYLADVYRQKAAEGKLDPGVCHQMAFDLYEKAHVAGHPRSSYLLGRYLVDGFNGVPGGESVIDVPRAKQCFVQAAKSGFLVASEEDTSLANTLGI